ncbi:hypothetical protein OS493_017891 [Desmophyllum pertusum]|uniref:Uncharacterized protein n=1 Tax=Desmophyllum pertusum TaxID=174260 RepID=A0A9W9Z066_9CNID|nr:hypothetical protein OS493_017891 [Desmophyllum pertusum]
MAALPRESLKVEPAVKAKGANKDLNQKNNRASHNWQKVRSALDREKVQWAKGVQDDRNKLLKQREMLRNTSLSFTRSDSLHSSSEEGAALQFNKPRMSLKDVYDALLKSSREQQDDASVSDIKSVRSEPAPIMSSTVSFEQKRVGRKPITFSLQGLQKANSNLQSKLQAMERAQQHTLTVEDEKHDERPKSGPPKSHFDLNDEERSLGPTLKLPPTHLPPITRGVSFKPHTRSYSKDEAYKRRTKGNEYSFDDIRFCRYLRKRGRTRSDTTVETTKKSVPRHHLRSTTKP